VAIIWALSFWILHLWFFKLNFPSLTDKSRVWRPHSFVRLYEKMFYFYVDGIALSGKTKFLVLPPPTLMAFEWTESNPWLLLFSSFAFLLVFTLSDLGQIMIFYFFDWSKSCVTSWWHSCTFWTDCLINPFLQSKAELGRVSCSNPT